MGKGFLLCACGKFSCADRGLNPGLLAHNQLDFPLDYTKPDSRAGTWALLLTPPLNPDSRAGTWALLLTVPMGQDLITDGEGFFALCVWEIQLRRPGIEPGALGS